MLGEASHGTHEYYTWRMAITKRLIEEKGFDFICVEGDWPDCYRFNRFVKNYSHAGSGAVDVMRQFDRWPTWMWGNWEVVALAEWLYGHNRPLPVNKKVGFYGLDVYSLWESMEAIIKYLQMEDPAALEKAKRAFDCFEPYRKDEGTGYAYASLMVPHACTNEVIDLLKEIQLKAPQYDSDYENVFSAEQNAIIAVNAEHYYRAMIHGGAQTWNIRDSHMMETLTRLLDFHGSNSKAIVWAHNTHIGDARATDMEREGMHNIGELARRRYGPSDVYLVGFGSYSGSVIASRAWGDVMQEFRVPEAVSGSWEHILSEAGPANTYIFMDDLKKAGLFRNEIGHRAIGVVYHPEREWGNYVPSRITERYDAFIFLRQSKALHPLHAHPDKLQIPETYPFGV